MSLNIENNPAFRPPSEAYSLVLQIDEGCPYNTCTFCGMYKGIRYRQRSMGDIENLIASYAKQAPHTRRIFLADGDVMVRPYEDLFTILTNLNQQFPKLTRVSTYACGRSILDKTPEQLAQLKALKLHTLYLGLESGDDQTLKNVHKYEMVEQMVQAGIRASEAGLRMNVMVLTGLGGQERSQEHVAQTAAALNAMQPAILACLRVIPIPGTKFHRDIQSGQITQLTEWEAVKELHDLIEQLDLKRTLLRADHSSNIVPLEGRFPRNKATMLADLKQLLDAGKLDKQGPGPQPLSL